MATYRCLIPHLCVPDLPGGGVAYNRRPMPKKTISQRDAERRSEARRRARLLAQGRDTEEEAEDEAVDAPAARPPVSILQRIFPPVAPLPGKPDPLAGFDYSGSLRPLALTLWLTRRNLFAGLGMGVLWAGTYILTVQYVGTLVGSIASFASFGSLVAAGWIGWQKPWLYGLIASVIGYLLYTAYAIAVITTTPPVGEPLTPSQMALGLTFNGLMQAGIGALAGFYGGYLRRRLADPTSRQAAAARRRR